MFPIDYRRTEQFLSEKVKIMKLDSGVVRLYVALLSERVSVDLLHAADTESIGSGRVGISECVCEWVSEREIQTCHELESIEV